MSDVVGNMDEQPPLPDRCCIFVTVIMVLIYLFHASCDVRVMGEGGADEGSGTGVVCCCSPQQMESVNMSTRPPWQTLIEGVVGATGC